MLLVKVIKSFGIVRNVIEFAKEVVQVKSQRQQHFGTYTIL